MNRKDYHIRLVISFLVIPLLIFGAEIPDRLVAEGRNHYQGKVVSAKLKEEREQQRLPRPKISKLKIPTSDIVKQNNTGIGLQSQSNVEITNKELVSDPDMFLRFHDNGRYALHSDDINVQTSSLPSILVKIDMLKAELDDILNRVFASDVQKQAAYKKIDEYYKNRFLELKKAWMKMHVAGFDIGSYEISLMPGSFADLNALINAKKNEINGLFLLKDENGIFLLPKSDEEKEAIKKELDMYYKSLKDQWIKKNVNPNYKRSDYEISDFIKMNIDTLRQEIAVKQEELKKMLKSLKYYRGVQKDKQMILDEFNHYYKELEYAWARRPSERMKRVVSNETVATIPVFNESPVSRNQRADSRSSSVVTSVNSDQTLDSNSPGNLSRTESLNVPRVSPVVVHRHVEIYRATEDTTTLKPYQVSGDGTGGDTKEAHRVAASRLKAGSVH